MDNTTIGDRMKGYESVPKMFLMKKTPVIMRLDGKAFHTFTKGLEKPYSWDLREAMCHTTEYLMENIQGAVFAYTQSDEISILIRDWDQPNTCGWFDYNLQKMVSISASMATAAFNDVFTHPTKKMPALFDSRVFNMPVHEVVNYFIWRQQDAERNSIQMLARSHFSHKQLDKKNTVAIQDMLMGLSDPVNWNDVATWSKRGSCVVTSQVEKESGKMRRLIEIDQEIPIFSQDRDYINQHLIVPGTGRRS